jgi:anaerobic selenocysteine-containing dehydrogenase
LRSNDQFNTTVYGYKDRYRDIFGTRNVVLVNPADIERLGLSDGDLVDVLGDDSDGIDRSVLGFRLIAYNIPEKCCAGYYPECNAVIPWWHHAKTATHRRPNSCGCEFGKPLRQRRHRQWLEALRLCQNPSSITPSKKSGLKTRCDQRSRPVKPS